MAEPMTPREIQQRIRSGDSFDEVVSASGMDRERVEVFAAPIIAEREHTTTVALASPVRRRGETASARRLSQTVAESLLNEGQDIDFVSWDSWRRSDGRWVLQGSWTHDGSEHVAVFIFDPKGRFCVADNDEARLLIGDLPVGRVRNRSTESTVGLSRQSLSAGISLAEESTMDLPDPNEEDSLRSDIDLLYSMISTLDEDSVRIFRGLREPITDANADQPLLIDESAIAPKESDPTAQSTSTGRKKRKRATVPSWDDIIFGGQS